MTSPDPRRDRAFSTRDALAAGMTRAELRRHDLQQFFHGARARGLDESEVRHRALAYMPRMVERAAFSHVTAARLWGMPLPLWSKKSRELHVSVPSGRAPRGRGVLGHCTSELGRPRTVAGLRLVHPALAWAQCAESLDVADLVAAGDFAVTGDPLHDIPAPTTIAALRRAAGLLDGRRGSARRAQALELIRIGSISRPESLSRLLFVSSGLPEPELNLELRDARGTRIAVLDQAWPEFRVGYDYDGREHTTVERFRRDLARAGAVGDERWAHVRGTALDLFDQPEALVRRLAIRLGDGGWRGRTHSSRFTPFER
ncbi:MAG: hypothetical protein QM635_10800 [Microbacteriaceae bacterium]